MALHHYLDKAAAKRLEHTAIEEPGGASITYGDFVVLTDRVRDRWLFTLARRLRSGTKTRHGGHDREPPWGLA